MEKSKISKGVLTRIILTRVLPAIIVLMMIFFIPAGTFAYWEAWAYCLCLFIPMALIFTYLTINDPELLERRMKMREKVKEQKTIITASYPGFLLAFILPGFDHRFGWSNVSPAIVVLSLFCFLVGYGFFFYVLRTNSYASRVIEVAADQKVISTGPYAIVRHPMYMSVLMMYLFSPLALGSYWAMIPMILVIPVLVARILNEEKVLEKDLPGYQEYIEKVKFRLIPKFW
jgi:protein-S-isoprenylcysteine O-methyltransferase Ste14